MSYQISINVKVEGYDKYVFLTEPTYAEPTYNYRPMFEACMDWDYNQSEYYPCDFVMEKITKGIVELRNNRETYLKYEPSNGWGDINGAIRTLESIRECIIEDCHEIAFKDLYMKWG